MMIGSARDATRAAAGAILGERGRSVGRLLADEACATGSCNAGAAMRVLFTSKPMMRLRMNGYGGFGPWT